MKKKEVKSILSFTSVNHIILENELSVARVQDLIVCVYLSLLKIYFRQIFDPVAIPPTNVASKLQAGLANVNKSHGTAL